MLLPAFKERYPGTKLILVLDNAPYHCHHPSSGLDAAKVTKTVLCETAKETGLKTFPVSRKLANGSTGKKTFDSAILKNRANGKDSPGPYVDELIRAVKKHFAKFYPELFMTDLELISAKFENAGFELIFTTS